MNREQKQSEKHCLTSSVEAKQMDPDAMVEKV